jgi:predicted TIM-barrel fold metal-dependent hydrolase
MLYSAILSFFLAPQTFRRFPMIIDSHCHAWSYWPYKPEVPDPKRRGRVEHLLHEMDVNGVDRALIVSAQIDHNPENNAYVAEQVARYPDRLDQLVDLDSSWSERYHAPGAGERLRRMAERWPIKGFTHYLKPEDDGGWLTSPEGQALFQTAADLGLVASLSCYPHQQAAIRRVAARFPTVPVLCHHLGMVRVGEDGGYEGLQAVLASASVPNIYIKLSGFAYAAPVKWAFPYTEAQPIVRAEIERFGPQRMCWGSDYPVVRFFMTYRQALEAFRTHSSLLCDLTQQDQALILGGNLVRLLGYA